ncbi:MAG: flagellar filament capping protein FliD [Deltaproteobacteria bacterium]|nr:flagellar filament capping protein FliD [Deltaproteobacteria bacterium]
MSISATSGVVSNIDYQTLISQLVGIRQQSITQLSDDKKTLEKTNSAYSNLSSKVDELKSAADALRTLSSFNVFKTSVTDETILGASASSTAAKGSYSIVVTNIAKAHKIAADGYASDTSTVAGGAGFFKFTVGAGAEQTIAVDGTTTLAGLRDSINALGAGVTASIVNDGSASPYRLILTSSSTGASNGVAITQNDTTAAFNTTLQAAQDASFTVDTMTFTRASNTVSDVITGVTFDIKSGDPAKTVTLSVERDSDKIAEKVTDFVEKYNSIVSYIKANNRYDSETKVAGVFFGDTVARSVWDDLRKVMSGAVTGLPDTMNRLLHIGITSNTDGVFSLDSSKLKTALSTSFDDVVALFEDGTTTDGFGALMYNSASSITDTVDGRIKGRQDGLQDNIKKIEDDIRNKEYTLSLYEDQLRSQFMGLETMLASLKSQSNFLSNL